MRTLGLILGVSVLFLAGSASAYAQTSIADLVPVSATPIPTPLPVATAAPSAAPATPTIRPTATAKATSSGDTTLPDTGAEAFYLVGAAGAALVGISIYQLRRQRRN